MGPEFARALILIGAVSLFAGCASQPGIPKTTGPVAAHTAAATPAPATAGAPAPETTATTAAADAKPFKPPSGYRTKKLGANTVYCRKDKVLGTIFPTEICLSEDELKELERRGEDMRVDKQRAQGICGGAGSCGN